MLKIITTLTLFLIGILAKGQEVEMRTVSSFSKIKVQHGIELVYTESATTSIRIEAPSQSNMNNITTKVSGKTLTIDVLNAKEFNQNDTNIKVFVATNNLVELEANTKASITIDEALVAEKLNIKLSSGASLTGTMKVNGTTMLQASENTSFNGKIEASAINGNFSQNAKINLTGKSQLATFETADTVLLAARNFISNTITVKASGNSSASIYANSHLAVDVADEAKITYSGFPDNINLNEEAVAFQKYRNDRALTLN
jgi:hypothetical protein